MDWGAIVVILLIGGVFIAGAVRAPFESGRRGRPRRWLDFAGSALMVVGAVGFFGSGLSAVGGLNWLPPSFEWPIGHSDAVFSTPEGIHVVPHEASGRIQIYDASWRFVRGWHVDAGGGIFKIVSAAGDRIEVVTRGHRRYVLDMEGRVVARSEYPPGDYRRSLPDLGRDAWVPTRPWLWSFTHPFLSWATAAVGMALLIARDPQRVSRRRARR